MPDEMERSVHESATIHQGLICVSAVTHTLKLLHRKQKAGMGENNQKKI